jgi:hypothetical protein
MNAAKDSMVDPADSAPDESFAAVDSLAAAHPSGERSAETETRPAGTGAGKSRESQPQLLSIGGASLLAYCTYSLVYLITSNPSASPLVVIDRITGFISLFPPLMLGCVLLIYSFPPQPIFTESLWKKLLRQLVAVITIAYLLCAPITAIQAISQRRIEFSDLSRATEQLTARRQQIMDSISSLTTKAEFEAALGQFAEISAIRISPTDPPAETIRGVGKAIDTALDLQIQTLKSEQSQRLASLQSRARLATAGSLVSGIAFLALGVQVVPWMSALSRFLNQLQKQALTLFKRLGQNLPDSNKSKPSPERTAAAAKARAASARRSIAARQAMSNLQRRWRNSWSSLQSSLAKLRPGSRSKGSSRPSRSKRRRRS